MSRLQFVLVVTLTVLVSVVFGRVAWGVLGPSLAAFAVAVPAFAQSIPAWVWWTAVGSLWWLPWVFGKHTCRRSAPSTSAA